MWEPDEFIQINFVEFIYFQIVTIVGTLILVLPAVFYYREDVKKLYGLQIPYFEGHLQGVVLILLVLLIVAISFSFYEVLAGILLWAYVHSCHKDFKNPYLEKIKATQNLEEYKVYQKRKLREAYEKMADETVYQPKPLFENTKYFKQITDIEQVKPRYHAMMKIYHPDNPGGSVEISQEIQKEYKIIATKYNL